MKFGTRVRLKPSNDGGEFELDRARIKNNIADNSVALGYETHNTLSLLTHFYECVIFYQFQHIINTHPS